MDKFAVPENEVVSKVSPIPLIAPPPCGREIAGTEILLLVTCILYAHYLICDSNARRKQNQQT
jgi:hypothetical protein